MVLWFGKYRGCQLEDVPESYLAWMVDAMERESLRDLARGELERRAAERRYKPKQLSVNFDRITWEMIEAGYRALAKRCHPDLGGDLRKMQELNAAMEKLRAK